MLGKIVGIDFDYHLCDLGFTEQRHQCFDDLVFMAFHVDLDGDAAAGGDLLNKWTTPVGSAVFVIPAGFDLDSYPGRGLF